MRYYKIGNTDLLNPPEGVDMRVQDVEPTDTRTDGTVWVDRVNNLVKRWNSATSQWVEIPGGTASAGTTTAPSAPTGLSSSNVADTSLTLTWVAPAEAVTGYRVTINAVTYTVTGATAGDAPPTSLAVTGLTIASSYPVQVIAYNGVGDSAALTGSVATAGLWDQELLPSGGVLPASAGWTYLQNGQTTAITDGVFVMNSATSVYGFYSRSFTDAAGFPITVDLPGWRIASGTGNLWMIELYNGSFSVNWRPRPDGLYQGVSLVHAVDLTVAHDLRAIIAANGVGSVYVDGTLAHTYQGAANTSRTLRWGQDTAGIAQLRIAAIRYALKVVTP